MDIEQRTASEDVSRIWHKLTSKVEAALDRGESVILLGDFNRPLQTIRQSAGTKLLNQWLEVGQMTLLNNPRTSTRWDPASGNGSTLDLGIVSTNIKGAVQSFEVDMMKKWTPFALMKKRGVVEKKFTDHLSICLQVKLPIAATEKKKKIPMIDWSNPNGWIKYKAESDKIAEGIINAARNPDLNIEEVRAHIEVLKLQAGIASFGITWRSTGGKPSKKKKKAKNCQELFNEQYE